MVIGRVYTILVWLRVACQGNSDVVKGSPESTHHVSSFKLVVCLIMTQSGS